MNFERCYVEKPLDTTKGKVFKGAMGSGTIVPLSVNAS